MLIRCNFAARGSSHRAGIKGELGRKVHARRKSKGVHIEHRIVRVHQLLGQRSILLSIVAGLGHLEVANLLLASSRGRKWLKGRWIGPRPRDLFSFLVIDHIGLRLVLLFCTHGINLGRT